MDFVLTYVRGLLIACAILAFASVLAGVLLSGSENPVNPVIVALRRSAAGLVVLGFLLLATVGFLKLFC